MIASLVRALLALAGLIVIVLFAVANRGPVAVSLVVLANPVTLPVYALLLIGLLMGTILGGIAVWLGGWQSRREGKRAKRRLATIEARELHEHQREEEALQAERKARRQQLALTAGEKAA